MIKWHYIYLSTKARHYFNEMNRIAGHLATKLKLDLFDKCLRNLDSNLWGGLALQINIKNLEKKKL